MVSWRHSSSTLKGTNISGDTDATTEIRAPIDELRRHNWMLEDDIHNIRQHQQEVNPPKEVELLDPGHSQTRYRERLFLRVSNPYSWLILMDVSIPTSK